MLSAFRTISGSSNDDVFFINRSIDGLHGVKHMRSNLRGDYFWKNIYLGTIKGVADIQYYDIVQALGLKCHNLERLNVPVSQSTVIDHANWFSTMRFNEPYKALLARCPDIYVGSDTLLIRFRRASAEFDGDRWHYYRLGSRVWHERCRYTSLEKQGFECKSLDNSDLCAVIQCLEYFNVPNNLLSVMSIEFNPRSVK